MTTKKCFKCLIKKPLVDFYKHTAMKDGHLNKCKSCAKDDVVKHRQNNLEKIRSYDRMRASMPHRITARLVYSKTSAFAKSHIAASKNWAMKNSLRRKASHMVSNAIRDKVLIKTPCHICGILKVEGHHPDYNRPLDVVWLCSKHHHEIHKKY